MKKNVRIHVTSHVVPAQGSKKRLDSKRFSTWRKLLIVTAWVKRFLYNCQLLKIGKLSADEITDAETHLIHCAKNKVFHQEFLQ